MKRKLAILLISIFLFILTFDTCQQDNIFELVNTIYTYITVDETSPAASELDIVKNTTITITFSQQVDPITFADAFSLTDASGTSFPITNYTVTWSTNSITGQSTVSLSNPIADLTGDNIITLTLSSNILRSTGGNPMQYDYFMSFITGSLSDSVPPNLTSYTLQSSSGNLTGTAIDGATVYPVDGIAFLFNEPMVKTSVEGAFSLTADGTPVAPSQINWTADRTGVTFVFAAGQVPENSSCLVNLTSSSLDGGGNGLANPIQNLTFYAGAFAGSDSFESNNSFAEAKAITLGQSIFATIHTNAPLDADYFSVTLTAGKLYNFRLGNLPFDYNLYLHDNTAGNTLLGSSINTGTTTEVISYTPSTTGTYFIRVESTGSFTDTQTYTLLAEEVTGDASEPGDNASTGATAMTVGQSYNDHSLHVSTDVDYFTAPLTTGLSYTIILSAPGTENYDFKLWSPDQSTVVASGLTGGNEVVAYSPSASGTYYLEVFSASGSNTLFYTLLVSEAAGVDYIFVGDTAPTTAPSSTTSNVDLTLKNVGGTTGVASVGWKVYLSTDTTIGGDSLLGSGTFTGLAAGATKTLGVTVNWPVTSGDYYLLTELTTTDDTNTLNNPYTVGPISVSNGVVYNFTGNNAPSSGLPGVAYSVNFAFQNVGSSPGVQTVIYNVYLSSDANLGNDTLVGTGTTSGLAVGASYPFVVTGNWPATNGDYYLIAEVTAADAGDSVYTVGPISVAGGTNYLFGSSTIPSAGVPSSSFSVDFDLQNAGNVAGGQDALWKVYLSSDTTIGGDSLVGSGTITGGLGAGASQTVTASGSWPMINGDYYLLAEVTATDDINSTDNQYNAGPITISGGIDYTYTADTMPTSSTPSTAFSVDFTLQNIGNAAGSQNVAWNIYLSSDTTIGGDTLVGTGTIVGGLAALGTQTVNASGNWSATPGTYYLLAQVIAGDDTNAPANNQYNAGPVSITGGIDYSYTSDAAPSAAIPNAVFSVDFNLKNTGNAAGVQNVTWNIYLSSDQVVGSDTLVGNGTIVGGLGVGVSQTVTATGNWPASTGTYYLLAVVSAADDTLSANDQYNSAAISVTGGVDYGYTADTAPATATSGTTFSLLTFTFKNIGNAAGTVDAGCEVYLSTDTTLDAGDTLVGTGTATGGLAVNATTNCSASGTWPGVATATPYYFIAKVTATDDINSANDLYTSAVITLSGSGVNYNISAANYPAVTGEIGGATISGDFTVTNGGTLNGSQNLDWTVYLSANNILDVGTDTVITSGTITGGLTTGGNQLVPYSGTWPTGAGDTSFWMFVTVAAADDYDTSDNTSSSANITITQPIDYYVKNVAITSSTPHLTDQNGGDNIAGTFQIENIGTSPGAASRSVTIELYDNSSTLVGALTSTSPTDTGTAIAAGATSNYTFSGNLPTIIGTAPNDQYTLKVTIGTQASDPPGNDIASSTGFNLYTFTEVASGTPSIFSTTTYVRCTVPSYTGSGASGEVKIFRKLGTDPAGSEIEIATITGTTYYDYSIPINTVYDYYYQAFTPRGALGGGPPAAYIGSARRRTADYDIAITSRPTGTLAGGEGYTMVFDVNNIGQEPGAADVTWTVYYSTSPDAAIDGSDTVAGYGTIFGGLAAGGSLTINFTGTFPTTGGPYYLLVEVAATDDYNSTNNKADSTSTPTSEEGASVAIGGDDARETNDSSAEADANASAQFTTADYNLFDPNFAKISHSTDQDYFRFGTTSGKVYTVIMVPPAGTDYDITVYASDGVSIVTASATGGVATQETAYFVSGGGNYYVKVSSNGDFDATNDYIFLFNELAISVPDVTVTGATYPAGLGLIWTASANMGGSDYYLIERGPNTGVCGSYTQIASVTGNLTSYTDYGASILVAGPTTYCYRVRAYYTTPDVYTIYGTTSTATRSYAPVTMNPSGTIYVILNDTLTFSGFGGDYSYAYTSSNTGVATFAGNVLTGIATGPTTITVDDGINTPATAVVTVIPNWDYKVSAVNLTSSNWYSGATQGDTASGTFTVENIGTATDPGGNFTWNVHLSTGTTTAGSRGVVVSGNSAALGAGAWTEISFSGNWPAGTYSGGHSVVVEVIAGSGTDADSTNNVREDSTALTIINLATPAAPGTNTPTNTYCLLPNPFPPPACLASCTDYWYWVTWATVPGADTYRLISSGGWDAYYAGLTVQVGFSFCANIPPLVNWQVQAYRTAGAISGWSTNLSY